jgi:hypothetical protein
MTRALEPLRQKLSPGPSLEPLDARLTALTDAAERRQFRDAADRAEGLFAEGIYDVRAISIYLYQAFLEGGLGSLAAIFATSAACVGDNLGALGPERRRDEHVDRRFAWLFETTLGSIEYHVRKRSAEWTRWSAGVGPEALGPAIEAGEALGERLGAGPFASARAQLAGLLARLRGLVADLRVNEPPAPADAAPAAPPPAAPATLESLEPLRRRIELVASNHFIELLCKLKAFETLVEKRQYQKAALVGDDLLKTLDNFDPLVHFPDLFATFSALLSEHVSALSPHWEDRDSTSWQALSRFYRVDLKGFVGG